MRWQSKWQPTYLLVGAGATLSASPDNAATLCAKVATEKGTTEAMFTEWMELGGSSSLFAGLNAASKRAEEIEKELTTRQPESSPDQPQTDTQKKGLTL